MRDCSEAEPGRKITSSRRPPRRGEVLAVTLAISFAIAGCGGGSGSEGGGRAQSVSGQVNGGVPQDPIAGSTVSLYVIGNSGYGTGTSLVTSTTANSTGAFSFGTYQCPSPISGQTFVTVNGGDAGTGSNAAIAMIALTGSCNELTPSTFITINELTSVAAEWALARFTDSTGQNIGTSPTNSVGIDNAINQTFSNLAVSYLTTGGNADNTGVPAAFWANSGASDSGCTGASPPINCDGLERMNTLANAMADCINASGPGYTQCQQLFCGATPGAVWNSQSLSCSTTPTITNTLQAIHSIVLNPQSNVGTTFDITPPPGVSQFTPVLASAPDGWELGLTFSPSGSNFVQPTGLGLDSLGNVWVANGNGNTVTELNPDGSLGGNFNPSGANFLGPTGLAIDSSSSVWIVNSGGSSLTKLNPDGSLAGYFNSTDYPFRSPFGIGLDSSGDIWVTNIFSRSVTKLNADGKLLGSFHQACARFNFPLGITLDNAGHAWIANNGNNSVTELASDGSIVGNFSPVSARFDEPIRIALDNSGNAWVTNASGGSVTELNPDGSVLGSFGQSGAFDSPDGIAIDSNGNVWVANTNSVTELNSSGNVLGIFDPPGAGLAGSGTLALDSSGNVWVANNSGNTVGVLIGAAGPVLTPIQQCLINGSNVCTP